MDLLQVSLLVLVTKVFKDEVVQQIADIWNANCPAKYRKENHLVGIYLDEEPTPTGGII